MGKRIVLTILGLLLAGAVAVYFLVQPARALNLNYQKVPWNELITSAVVNLGVVNFSEVDLSNLLKEQISKKVQEKQWPITGADIQLETNKVIANFNLQKGSLPIGIQVEGDLQYSNNKLLFTPTAYKIGKIPVSAATFESVIGASGVPLKTPIPIDIKPYVPAEITVKKVTVLDDRLQVVLVPTLFR